MPHTRAAWPLLLLLAGGCSRTEPQPPGTNPPPVDLTLVGSVEAVAGWSYQREVQADLDGDEQPERVVIAADVGVGPGGRLVWEDGHRWAVFAQSPDGRRTLLYASFVPRGFAEAAVLTPDENGRRRVLVHERRAEQVRALEVEYRGPEAAYSTSDAVHRIQEWLPGSATPLDGPPPPLPGDTAGRTP